MVPETGQKRLETWNEIGGYLGITARTAQTWEEERGMPVHRLPGPRSRVFAIPAELDEWQRSLDKPAEAALTEPRRKRLIWWALAGLAGITVVFAGTAHWRSGLEPEYVKVDGPVLRVYGQKGEELWSYPLPGGGTSLRSDAASDLIGLRSWVGDLDGDGRKEVLYGHWRPNPTQDGTELLCFNSAGRLLWQYRPGHKVRTAFETFDGPYFLREFRVTRLREGESWSIITTSHHNKDFPNVVSRLSPSGQVMAEYWHSGNLWRFELADLDRDGTAEVILAGVNNGRHLATVIVLDPRRMNGASREENTALQLLGLAEAREKSRVWLPRSCINRKFLPFPHVTNLVVQPAEIRVETTEWTEPPVVATVSFQLDPSLRLLAGSPSSYFMALHERLRREGRLDHDWSEPEQRELSGGR